MSFIAEETELVTASFGYNEKEAIRASNVFGKDIRSPASASHLTNVAPAALSHQSVSIENSEDQEEDNSLSPKMIECCICYIPYALESIDLSPLVFNSMEAAHGKFCYFCLSCSNAEDRHSTSSALSDCRNLIVNKYNTGRNKIQKLLDIHTNPPSPSALSKSPSLSALVLSLLPTPPPPFYLAYLPTSSHNHRCTSRSKQLLKANKRPRYSNLGRQRHCLPQSGQVANAGSQK